MDRIMQLMEIAEERIQQYLPEDYEMDDLQWCDDGFQISVFDVSMIEIYQKGPAGIFRFFLSKCETDEENTERFNRQLQEFAESWK